MGGYRIYVVMLRHLLNLLPTHIDAKILRMMNMFNLQIKIPYFKGPQQFREKFLKPKSNYYFLEKRYNIIACVQFENDWKQLQFIKENQIILIFMQVNKSPFPTVLELGICGLSNWMAYPLCYRVI